MGQVMEGMKVARANAYALQLKAQNYHWNVEGSDFKQYHDLLGDIYTEIYASVDVFAEEIRALGAYAPGSFSRFSQLSSIADEQNVPDALTMLARLKNDIVTCRDQLTPLFELSESSKTYGLSDVIAGRIDALNKHIWMLTATTKV